MSLKNKGVCIILPVFNEGDLATKTIQEILAVTKIPIIAVDDGSTRGDTLNKLKNIEKKEKNLTVLHHVINLGKGAAMKTGCEYAWENGFEAVIFMDSDGQHSPRHVKTFLRILREGNSIVFGYRDLGNKMPIVRRFGNMIASKVVSSLFNINKKDLLSGFFAINKNIYPKIVWNSSRYGVETEIATKIGKMRLGFVEIPIDTIYLDKHKGVSVLDALKILLHIPIWYIKK